MLASFDVEPLKSDFGAAVEAVIAVPVESAEEIEGALRDATDGRIEIFPA